MNITLNLTADQVNLILAILSEQPYTRVATLIEPIVTQGRPQVEAFEASKTEQESEVAS